MSSPFSPPFCFQWEQAEREKAFIILSWQHRTHATFLWVTSRSNRGGNGALNCLSFICLLLSLISTSCEAWREHEPLFQREHVQVQRFYSTMVLHSFHKFTLVCVCWSSPEKNKVSRSSRCLTFTSCFTLTSEINFKVNL